MAQRNRILANKIRKIRIFDNFPKKKFINAKKVPLDSFSLKDLKRVVDLLK